MGRSAGVSGEERPGKRSQLAGSTEPEEEAGGGTLQSDVTSTSDPRMEYRVLKLQEAYAEFTAGKDVTTAGTLMQYSVIAWSDHFGTTVPHVAGTAPPRQVYTDQEWTLGVADQFGGHIIVYSRADFPECWELRAVETGHGREMFDLSVAPNLLARVEERAKMVMEIVKGR
jgi:hypothetical protein